MLRRNTIFALQTAQVARRSFQRRFLHQGAVLSAVQPYLMPAMSPTMEKGGIVEWKVAPGASFSAGDVLLEIETDKAQIDVEAQDDGQLVKILRNNGEKDIDVGETIAFTAEPEDDLAKVDLASLTGGSKPVSEPKESAQPAVKKAVASAASASASASTSASVSPTNPNKEQTLLPSVAILLAENGISRDEAIAKIPGTGLHGALLKGDILAYLGTIPTDAAASIGSYIDKSKHLDLSNIEKTVLKSVVKEEVKEDVKQEAVRTPVITLEEDIKLSVPNTVTPGQLHSSVKSFLQEAYQYAHLGDLSQMQSEHYDPVFDDLVTPERRAPRFSYAFDLQPVEGREVHHDDIFDLLAGVETTTSTATTTTIAPTTEYIVSLDITVNNVFADSREKANLFMDYVLDLEDAQA